MRPERNTPSDPSDTVSSGGGGGSGSGGGAGRLSRLPALRTQLEAFHLRSGFAMPDIYAPQNVNHWSARLDKQCRLKSYRAESVPARLRMDLS